MTTLLIFFAIVAIVFVASYCKGARDQRAADRRQLNSLHRQLQDLRNRTALDCAAPATVGERYHFGAYDVAETDE